MNYLTDKVPVMNTAQVLFAVEKMALFQVWQIMYLCYDHMYMCPVGFHSFL